MEFDLVGSILTEVKTTYDRRCINPNTMEAPMSIRTIKHEIKLPKYLIVLLAMLVIGLFANAFAPVFSSKDAYANAYNIASAIDGLDSSVGSGLANLALAINGIDCRR